MTWLEYLRAPHCLSCWDLYWQHPYRTWSCSGQLTRRGWSQSAYRSATGRGWAKAQNTDALLQRKLWHVSDIIHTVHRWGNQHLCQDQWLAKRCLPLAADAQVWSAVGWCSLAEDTGLLRNTSLDKKWQEGANWLQMKRRKYHEIPENQHWTADLSFAQVMYNATINACKGERWQIALSLLFELERPLNPWLPYAAMTIFVQKTWRQWKSAGKPWRKMTSASTAPLALQSITGLWPCYCLLKHRTAMIRWGPVLAWNVRDDISGDCSLEIRPLVQKQHIASYCGVSTCSLKKHQLKSAVMIVMLPATTFLVSLCFLFNYILYSFIIYMNLRIS